MLSRIKKQQAETRDAAGQSHSFGGGPSTASSEPVAILRLKKDLDNLDGIRSTIDIPDPQNMLRMKVTVRPPYPSIWQGGIFEFLLEFREDYPYEGPRVRYLGPYRIWHPNIEGDEYTEGEGGLRGDVKNTWGVCLSFQTEWKPTMSLRDIIIMIELLFQDPNPDDPLHGTAKQAAQMMKDNPAKFRDKARRWMRGCYIE
ncbi:ubiquitin-conjugating enzyme E2 [Trypanosoma cruzi]|uniref:Putative ubiquitin-conjugating enzyme E2 n=1 Tax=Trypanosoma cruzi TaxID=5693 RepID=A0A2V2UH54_TRYCR|nr:putative ubiquitin-conjugating enzyme E2 [Trypanosoma cruzi]PBJ78218.1 ubiquitin-conjugating enzyme E2 [Trypanosoma cruzi cruzi]PWU83301.1 putative ubiquitin-conjugating enzyme E2 [Trypanosoma cruzi]PWU93260.1 putative ubiquitin-conjugating enzyme E2 [Trypanosoma cruzi]RNF13837.1 ubiquitin-conjugating enzyme E2 [Trypanosoma cruzi]